MISAGDFSEVQGLSVADVALQFPSGRHILNQYKIDYCCGGRKLFGEACRMAGVEPEKVWTAIKTLDSSDFSQNLRFSEWSAPFLIDYIQENHHQHARQILPEIHELLNNVCNVHGDHEPILYQIRETFEELSEDLIHHMDKEEQFVFPAIRRAFCKKGASLKDLPFPEHIITPVSAMETEHDLIGSHLKILRGLTNQYTPRPDACPTYRFTFKRLQELDNDLVAHIFLQNSVLFKKVTL